MDSFSLESGKYKKVPDYATIKHALELVREPEARACLCTIYAVAARQSEILGSQRKYTRNPAPIFSKELNKYVLPKSFEMTSIVPALTFGDVHFDEKNAAIYFDVFVAKKKGKKVYRQSFVFMESEQWLFNILFDYFFIVDKNETVLKAGVAEKKCFGVDYNHVKYVFSTDILPVIAMPSAPHILRHARCSHKIKVFGYTLQELFEEMKWGNLNQALTYSHQDNTRQEKMKKLGVIKNGFE